LTRATGERQRTHARAALLQQLQLTVLQMMLPKGMLLLLMMKMTMILTVVFGGGGLCTWGCHKIQLGRCCS